MGDRPTPKQSLDSKYFEAVYAARDDPWDFETSAYEKAKYAATLRTLPCERYARALEVGTSIGVLTEQLAPRCDYLLSVDVSAKALARARERCRNLPQAELREMSVPHQFPDGEFGLILVSEVAYYFSDADLSLLATRCAEHQKGKADLVLVHLTEKVKDYPQTGDQVHNFFLSRPEWESLQSTREERYRIDVLRRRANP